MYIYTPRETNSFLNIPFVLGCTYTLRHIIPFNTFTCPRYTYFNLFKFLSNIPFETSFNTLQRSISVKSCLRTDSFWVVPYNRGSTYAHAEHPPRKHVTTELDIIGTSAEEARTGHMLDLRESVFFRSCWAYRNRTPLYLTISFFSLPYAKHRLRIGLL